MGRGGVLILSGLLTRQAEEVSDAYVAQGLELLETVPDGDWASLLMTRRP